MKDLLNANFFRLKKDKTFKIFITIAITITILRILLGYQQMQKIETAGINIETIIIDFMQIIGIFIAMFVSLFVGRDYSYGIIRNKIIAGKTRTNIYLSNLVVSIFATTIIATQYGFIDKGAIIKEIYSKELRKKTLEEHYTYLIGK